MAYLKSPLQQSVVISDIYTFYYHELSKTFSFPGESHNFWEMLYVDAGRIEIFAYDTSFIMNQGDFLLLKPDVFHMSRTADQLAPNSVNISFECDSEAIKLFENRVISLNDQERNLLAEIVKEGFSTFQPRIDTCPESQSGVLRRIDAPFGSEQMIKTGLERLLIQLVRRIANPQNNKLSFPSKEHKENDLIEQIKTFMKENINLSFSLDQLCSSVNIGKSQIKDIFLRRTGIGLQQYYLELKIIEAKSLIREEQYNFTEIAEKLGYGSVHYFSRRFKQETGMTPSEYAKSIKSRF
ncbi:AraC family transcriptional regulator [Paenibacillus contaminans]|uniref:AraC family transcriptional regulator n=1 Tax=Paenibacillus contaminans TaxID=450362 RepID=A0A329MGJ7_9BACL|nr:AraC family transcriptional regulator [Paenibacillus contaminans]RAV17793.1 AraC family transcriptional regulator [Paenibacillus contaminans]